MTSTDTLTLQAFIAALALLPNSLPAEVQQEVNQFGASLKNEQASIANRLIKIALNYQPLWQEYQPAYDFFLEQYQAKERNKVIRLPQNSSPEPESAVPELVNESAATINDIIPFFTAKDSVETIKEAKSQNESALAQPTEESTDVYSWVVAHWGL
jgi:hypothetical protein